MKDVGKYNTFKAISTVLTVGTPLITLATCSNFFVHRSDTAVSAAGIFALLISLFFLKDKIAENFKLPSPFMIATVILILIVMIQSILEPIKYVCIMTMITTGIDELTFKRIYKRIGLLLPDASKAYFHLGFIFAKTETVVKHE